MCVSAYFLERSEVLVDADAVGALAELWHVVVGVEDGEGEAGGGEGGAVAAVEREGVGGAALAVQGREDREGEAARRPVVRGAEEVRVLVDAARLHRVRRRVQVDGRLQRHLLRLLLFHQ